jgi:hypothetical protein
MISQKIQSVRGMNDILPDEAEFWDLFDETIRSWLKSYGLSSAAPADRRADAAFQACHRRGNRHRRKGDVFLRR